MNDWIENKKRKPRKGGEYIVVWILDDNHYPVTTCMDYYAIEKVWVDRCNELRINHNKILYWKRLDKPPKGIPKAIYNPKNY